MPGTLAGAVSLSSGDAIPLLQNPIAAPVNLLTSATGQYVYWSDGGKSVFRLDRTANSVVQVITGDNSTVLSQLLRGLSLDEANNVLYFNDFSSIRVLNLTSAGSSLPVVASSCPVVFSYSLETQNVVFDAIHQHLYFSAWNPTNSQSSILRVPLGSSSPQLLVSGLNQALGLPHIALDIPNKRFFYADMLEAYRVDMFDNGTLSSHPILPLSYPATAVAYDPVNDWVAVTSLDGELYAVRSNGSQLQRRILPASYTVMFDIAFDALTAKKTGNPSFIFLYIYTDPDDGTTSAGKLVGASGPLPASNLAVSTLLSAVSSGLYFSVDSQLHTGYFVSPNYYTILSSEALQQGLTPPLTQTITNNAFSVDVIDDTVYYSSNQQITAYSPSNNVSKTLYTVTSCMTGGGTFIRADPTTGAYYWLLYGTVVKFDPSDSSCSVFAQIMYPSGLVDLDTQAGLLFYEQSPSYDSFLVYRHDAKTPVGNATLIYNMSYPGSYGICSLAVDSARQRLLISEYGPNGQTLYARDYSGNLIQQWLLGTADQNDLLSVTYDPVTDAVILRDPSRMQVYRMELETSNYQLITLDPLDYNNPSLVIDPSDPNKSGYVYFNRGMRVYRFPIDQVSNNGFTTPYEVVWSGITPSAEIHDKNFHYLSMFAMKPNSSLLYFTNVTSTTYASLYKVDTSNPQATPTLIGGIPYQLGFTIDWEYNFLFHADNYHYLFVPFDGETMGANWVALGSDYPSTYPSGLAIDHGRAKAFVVYEDLIVWYPYSSNATVLPTLKSTVLYRMASKFSYIANAIIDPASGLLYFRGFYGYDGSLLSVNVDTGVVNTYPTSAPLGFYAPSLAIDFTRKLVLSYQDGVSVTSQFAMYSLALGAPNTSLGVDTPLLHYQPVNQFLFEPTTGYAVYQFDNWGVYMASISNTGVTSNRLRVVIPAPSGVPAINWNTIVVRGVVYQPSTKSYSLMIVSSQFFGFQYWTTSVTLPTNPSSSVTASVPTTLSPDLTLTNTALTTRASPDGSLFAYVSSGAVVTVDISSQSLQSQQFFAFTAAYPAYSFATMLSDWDVYWDSSASPTATHTLFFAHINGTLLRQDASDEISVIFTPNPGYSIRSVACDSAAKVLYVGAKALSSCGDCQTHIMKMDFDGNVIERVAFTNAVDSLQLL